MGQISVFLTTLLLLLFSGLNEVLSCLTPLGHPGSWKPLQQCEQMLQLLETHRENMPERVRVFADKSRRAQLDEQHIVCCGDVINLKESDGAAILRNFETECGDNVGKRISFGQPTTLTRYPWAVLLIYDTGQRFHCGGTLVTQRYVLTAAHCVKPRNIELIGVRVGEHNLLTNPDCEDDMAGEPRCMSLVQDVDIEKTIPHSNYSAMTYNHDIALVRMARNIEFERTIRPICLPKFMIDYERPEGIITGWGATEESTSSSILMEAHVPIFEIQHCKDIYRRSLINWKLKICASGDNEIHTCNGDSGGPLMIRLENDQEEYARKLRYMQVGVISLGTNKCGESRSYPSVFTNVAAYMDWVEQNLEM